MAKKLNDQAQTQLALAALFAALAKTFGEQYELFPKVRCKSRTPSPENEGLGGRSMVALETLRWTSEILKDLRA